MLKNLAPNVISTPSHPREGVDIQFLESGIEVSEQWLMGDGSYSSSGYQLKSV